jgi:RHS repeat-associated protein
MARATYLREIKCNQYTQVGSLLVSSDRNGNLTSDQNGNTYSYDAQNRLISARSGTNTLSMTYDAQNRVVSRTVNGVKSTFVYAGWKMIAEYSATGSQLARYEQGPGSDEPLARTTPTSSIYYTQDGNGNVTAITSSSGAVQERYTYDVYGTPTIKNASGTVLSSSAVGNRFLFTGREYIAQIGLYDYRNRAYSPGLGRFLQTDPIRFDAGDINIYRYCGNDPGNGRDPMGLCIDKDGELAIDDDGKGDWHKDPDHKDHTSGKLDKNGNIVEAGDHEGLNADRDSYGVAPKDLSDHNGGKLHVGDKMDVKLQDGTQIKTRIGDFGPEGKNGEVSVKAAKDAGIPIKDKEGYGPLPKGPTIKVEVKYYPNTH